MDQKMTQKIQDLQRLKNLYQIKQILPIQIQKRKMQDISFQLDQLQNQQTKRLNNLVRNQSLQRKYTIQDSPSRRQRNPILIAQQNICLCCQQYIFENKITIECKSYQKHSYHHECLFKYLRNQLNNQPINFHCLCSQIISFADIRALKYTEVNACMEIVFDNQIKQLIQSLPVTKRCNNKNCSFFWISSPRKGHLSNKYCPNCNYLK